MAISGTKYRFTFENISRTPTYIGVYALYYGDVTIYIGKAEGAGGIKSRLESHKRGDMGTCTQRATAYRCEHNRNPSRREKELLVGYLRRFGRLPRCNDRVG
jgi:hypothetical protein